MSAEKITNNLVSAYQLIDFSERILEDIDRVPLEEIPRIISFVRKNLRDAAKLISDAEKELDEMVRNIDESEEIAELAEVVQ